MYTYIYFIIIYRQGPAARLDAAGALEALGRKDAVLAVVVLVADGDGERQQNAAAHVGNLGHFDCQQRHGGRVSFVDLIRCIYMYMYVYTSMIYISTASSATAGESLSLSWQGVLLLRRRRYSSK